MATPTRSGIPTTHAGSNFRSRLEARWAAFFDLVGWSWTYEPFDADGYIPDFLIHGEAPFLVEVGPCVTWADYVTKRAKPERAFPGTDVIVGEVGDRVLTTHRDFWTVVVGVTPILRLPAWRSPAIGTWPQSVLDMPGSLDPAFWEWCGTCGLPSLGQPFSDVSQDSKAPCGHGDYGRDQRIDEGWIEALWRRAGNDVQWRAPESSSVLVSRMHFEKRARGQ